jgi:hypothetical protein
MATICPYCNIEISESSIEAEDGCCPECGSVMTVSNIFDGEDDELDDEFDIDEEDDLLDDEFGGEEFLDEAFDDLDFDDMPEDFDYDR